MRIPFLAANWKMFKTVHEAVVFVKEFRNLVKDTTGAEVVIAPPFTALHAVAEAARNSQIGVAGQNLHWEDEGAFTGEISAAMLKEAGAEYVIIGHSERRRLFNETDQTVNKRLLTAVAAGLTPIVCVGETLDERLSDQTLTVLDRQIKVALQGLTAEQLAGLVLAYEPVWAIGTGHTASPQQASDAHSHIRRLLRVWFGDVPAEHCHIIYGGSVKPDNAHALVSLPDVDGALVGGASLDVQGFADIVTRTRHTGTR